MELREGLPMRYQLFALLGLLLINSCDSGGSNLASAGGAGPLVQFSTGCGNKQIRCPGGETIWFEPPRGGAPAQAQCRWRCATYTGQVDYDAYRSDGPASYIIVFERDADGCWEFKDISRGHPSC